MNAKIIGRLASRAARAFVAGPQLCDALGVCGILAKRGFGSTIGYWNTDHEAGDAVLRQYVLALGAKEMRALDCFPSVKAPALQYDEALLTQLIEPARCRRTPLHFDSLGPETADRTLHIIERLVPRYSTLGLTLPGRWRRSASDCDAAVQMGLRVRIVKGQWADDAGRDRELAFGFMDVVERIAGRALHVGVATHDAPLARRALCCLKRAGTACELELLWGLPCDQPLRVARELGVAVRFYVPYGHAWLPYTLSQAVRRPCIFLWFLRDAMSLRLPAASVYRLCNLHYPPPGKTGTDHYKTT